MAANRSPSFGGSFDATFSLDPPGNSGFVGQNVLQGLVEGIDDFCEGRERRWGQFRSLGPALLGATYVLDDEEFIASLGTLAGACVVVNKPDQRDSLAAYRRRAYRLLADVNEHTEGIPMAAFPALRDLAPWRVAAQRSWDRMVQHLVPAKSRQSAPSDIGRPRGDGASLSCMPRWRYSATSGGTTRTTVQG